MEQRIGFRHLSASGVSACKPSAGGGYHFHPVFLKQLKVVLRDWIIIHARIHGRRDNLRTLAGQDRGGQHIVRQPVREPRNHISSSRSDDGSVRLLGQRHMLHVKFKITVKCIGYTFMAGQRLERDRIDKVSGVFCHEHMHFRARFNEQAGERSAFICGDSACDAEKYCFSL